MRQIYLDYNATTPVAPSVCEALWPFLTEHYGNPSSTHWLGRACQQAIEDAREQVAELLGAQPDEIVFTSGGTESNNLAIKGVLQTLAGGQGHVVISALEHPAVVEPVRFLEAGGCTVSVVPSDRCGLVDPGDVAAALRSDTVLVSIMHANNEIGSIQPLRQISQLCRAHGVLLHTDAAQSAGKVRVQVDELGVDLLSLAGHKFYAPKGIGALYVRRGTGSSRSSMAPDRNRDSRRHGERRADCGTGRRRAAGRPRPGRKLRATEPLAGSFGVRLATSHRSVVEL